MLLKRLFQALLQIGTENNVYICPPTTPTPT